MSIYCKFRIYIYKAKKDKHKVGQKKQQKAKKGSDAVAMSPLGKMVTWIPRKWMDYLSDSSFSSEGETS